MARRSPPESGIKPVAWYFEKQDDWRELNKQTWRELEPGAWYLKKQVWRKRAAARVLFSNRPGWEAKFFGSLSKRAATPATLLMKFISGSRACLAMRPIRLIPIWPRLLRGKIMHFLMVECLRCAAWRSTKMPI